MIEQVSHYRLEQELGRGTYGVVYRATHAHDPDLRVAIKLVDPAIAADPAFVAALKLECRALDRLDHPGIVRFRDLVLLEGTAAMVLELLEGSDLHGRIGGGALAPDAVASLLERLLEALAYAHARGVVHRDIKPSNVFWCDDGRVKLLDFGIARAADGARSTKTGQVAGTMDYVAPERFSGATGPAADVYALGLTAWEALAGRPACPPGDVAAKVGWHLGVGAPRVRTVRPDVPAWLDEAITRMVSRDLATRPGDGQTALATWRALRAEAPSAVAPPPTPTGTRPPPMTVVVDTTAPPRNIDAPPPATVTTTAPPATDAPAAPSPQLRQALKGLAIGLPLAALIFGGFALAAWNAQRRPPEAPEVAETPPAVPPAATTPTPPAEAPVARVGDRAGGLEIIEWYTQRRPFSFHDARVTVVVFFETACRWCHTFVPPLEPLANRYRAAGFEVIGATNGMSSVSAFEASTDASVTAFLAETGVTFPVGREDGTMFRRFGIEGIPSAVAIRDGLVVWSGHASEVTAERVEGWLAGR